MEIDMDAVNRRRQQAAEYERRANIAEPIVADFEARLKLAQSCKTAEGIHGLLVLARLTSLDKLPDEWPIKFVERAGQVNTAAHKTLREWICQAYPAVERNGVGAIEREVAHLFSHTLNAVENLAKLLAPKRPMAKRPGPNGKTKKLKTRKSLYSQALTCNQVDEHSSERQIADACDIPRQTVGDDKRKGHWAAVVQGVRNGERFSPAKGDEPDISSHQLNRLRISRKI